MRFIPIKTRAMLPPKDNIYDVLDRHLPKLLDGDVLIITSKVLAIHQGRCIAMPDVDKDTLIAREADAFIPRPKTPKNAVMLTIKHHTLIASAGIDESNGNGYYVLWPKNINALLKDIHRHLCRKHSIKRLAIITTDSHLTPMRYGVIGISIGFYGLEPLLDYRGKNDIFKRKLVMTRANVVDALAAMSVLLMGESGEQKPLLIVRGASFIRFTKYNTWRSLIIPKHMDLYAPLFAPFFKKQNAAAIHRHRRDHPRWQDCVERKTHEHLDQPGR